MKSFVWLSLSLISLSACTVGPDFQRPQGPHVTQWSEPQGRQAASRAVTEPLRRFALADKRLCNALGNCSS